MYLTQVLHRAAQLSPHGVAVRFLHRQRRFGELRERVARLAAALRELGLQDGDRVAILALNSDRYLELQLAVPWAGGVINPCNVRWSVAELAYSLRDCASTVLVVDDAFASAVEAIRAACDTVRVVIHCGEGATPAGLLGYEDLVAGHAPMADRLRRGEDLAGVFYTGGTTGFPKGVMLSHRNLMSQALQVHAEGLARTGDVYLHSMPMFHLGDYGISLAHWIRGSTHAIVPGFSPAQFADAVARNGVTVAGVVPTAIQMLVADPALGDARLLTSLKTILYGGSPMPEALLDRVLDRLPWVQFVQVYGMTETSAVACVLHGNWHARDRRVLGRHRSAGRASLAVELRVVDGQGSEVPVGTVGEIIVRGAGVMQGYWGKPGETALALRDGWMHTGDGGVMDEGGFVFVVDRLKDMIISGGENVYSVEVENALGLHPAVAGAAVIGIPSGAWGETVHAVVVLKPGSSVDAATLIAHCRGLIAHYKCPTSVEVRDALPLSAAGKVLKSRLREPYWAAAGRQVS